MARRKSPKSELSNLLEATTSPVYALDEDGVILYCNQALCDWVSVPLESLVGLTAEYHSQLDSQSIQVVVNGLCPPPEVFEGVATAGHVVLMQEDGSFVYRRGHFEPLLTTKAGKPAGLLAILSTQDLSEEEVQEQLSPNAESDILHTAIHSFRIKQAEHYDVATLYGNSPAMQTVRRQVEIAAMTNAPVVIAGPKSSGREHVAKAIHYHAPFGPEQRFVALDGHSLACEELRWAYDSLSVETKAKRPSTILVTDVEYTSPEVQKTLLELCRKKTQSVRLIVTALKSLQQLTTDETIDTVIEEADDKVEGFHQVLATTLSTLRLEIPPLFQRMEDLPLLAQVFLEECNHTSGKQIRGLSRTAIELLATYAWPGEVNELRQVIRRAHANATGTQITPSDLPPLVHHAATQAKLPTEHHSPINLDEVLGKVEQDLIQKALKLAEGNKTHAAKLLGMSRPRFYRRLEQLGLE